MEIQTLLDRGTLDGDLDEEDLAFLREALSDGHTDAEEYASYLRGLAYEARCTADRLQRLADGEQ